MIQLLFTYSFDTPDAHPNLARDQAYSHLLALEENGNIRWENENGCLLLVIEMQSDVWQEIPDFDGADVEQKWIEGNPGYNLRVLHWTPTNEDCKRARTRDDSGLELGS